MVLHRDIVQLSHMVLGVRLHALCVYVLYIASVMYAACIVHSVY